MQVDGAHSQVFVHTSIAISLWAAPAVFLHKYVSIMSLCVNCMTRWKKSTFIILPLYSWYPVISGLVRLSRHVFFVYLHHPLTINHSVNTYEQVAGSLSPAESHSLIVRRESACDYIQHHYPPGGLKYVRKLEKDTAILRQGGPSRVTPLGAPRLHRSLFMLLFIMVPSNPCLVHYTRAAICQHLAGGLQGSKQQIGCTEPTM